MAGKGTISVNQMPQYGDKTVLEKLSESTTETPMTGNETPRPTAGRPPGPIDPTQTPPQAIPIPTAHQEAISDLAAKAWAANYWQQMASQPTAGPLTRLYAERAAEDYRQAYMKLRGRTPFFD